MSSTPSPSHIWRNPRPAPSQEKARALREGTRAMRLALTIDRGGAETLQGFRITHKLVYDGERVGELYRYRGEYYTLEQWTHGERGLTRADLREGEKFVKV
jgi:hypothetical protein